MDTFTLAFYVNWGLAKNSVWKPCTIQ